MSNSNNNMNSIFETRQVISNWLINVKREDNIPNKVIALCFHIQRTNNEFEVYLTGHDDFYYDHDTWLLGEIYESNENYKGLGVNSIKLSDQEMYEVYRLEVFDFIKNNLEFYPKNICFFNCRYPIGIPELLFER